MSMADDYGMDPPDSESMSASDMIDDLNYCGKLNDWAVEFVDSMLQRRDADPDLWERRLSEKQLAKLRELWERHCG